MTVLLLDTHTVHWWSSDRSRLSATAQAAITEATELCVADLTWYELAMPAERGKIEMSIPVPSWLRRLGSAVRTVPLSSAIAHRAVTLPAPFPRDPMDRIIFATAVEHGWPLVTKDRRLRDLPQPVPVTLW